MTNQELFLKLRNNFEVTAEQVREEKKKASMEVQENKLRLLVNRQGRNDELLEQQVEARKTTEKKRTRKPRAKKVDE